MAPRFLSRIQDKLNIEITLSLSIDYLNREQFVERRFYQKLAKQNLTTLDKQIELALQQMSQKDFLIIGVKGGRNAYIQYAIEEGRINLNYRVVPQTWDCRHIYWRYRTVLERHGYKPYKYHMSEIHNDIFNRKQYHFTETCTTRDLNVYVSHKEAGVLGRDCLEYAHGVASPDKAIFTFGSWKRWWEWI